MYARQQTLAMLDTITGEVVNRTLMHEGNAVREFYSQLPYPVLVGIEAIRSYYEASYECARRRPTPQEQTLAPADSLEKALAD